MKLQRIMIAAPKSGSGKTTITCALLQTLKNNGQQAVSYKCGPDYIDPMFHERIIGIPSKNLDTFFTGEEVTKDLLLRDRSERDFAVLEGVMGLYDGLGGIREEGSSYHLAKVTKTPIIFVVDAKGMGRSVIPILTGFLAYDTEHLIKGVILNRVSKTYYEILKPYIEEELQIKVLGYFPEQKELRMESRHLGLVMPEEIKGIREQLINAAEVFAKNVCVEEILRIADCAETLVQDNVLACHPAMPGKPADTFGSKPVIAVARDEAFCFYYADNLRMLQEYGAKIIFFSPLHDDKLPDGCHALLLGGGYPELYAKELSGNYRMREAVKEAAAQGMPLVAECGGFMYLHSEIRDKAGVRYAMADVIPGNCFDTGKTVRFGYIEIRESRSFFLPKGEQIRGHEFHYYDSTNNGRDCRASKPVTGKEYPCIIEGENYWLGFPHLYYPSNPAFAKCFVEKAKEYQEQAAGISMERTQKKRG